MTQVQWRSKRQPSGTVDADLLTVEPVKDSVNRFAREVIAVFDDPDGTKKVDYPRGQRVEWEVSTDGGSTFSRRMATTVVETTDRAVAGEFEVDAVGYDHYLRREDIHQESFSNTTISSALETLVTTYSPVTWNASNVSVSNDQTFSRTFEGVRLDDAISWLASISGDEDFGVNDDFEFFFQELDSNRAGSIVDGEWFDYDLPESGKRAVNRVTVFFGASGSEDAVTVDDREAQKDLKEKLDAARNVVISTTKTYPEIDNREAAEDKAREILNDRSTTITGTVTTFGRFNTNPGDVLRIQISEKSIDTDFRVADIEYNSARDETKLTVAENVGDVTELLVNLVDEVARLDIRDADPSVTPTRFLDLRSGVTFNVTSRLTTKTREAGSFTWGQSQWGDGTDDTWGGGVASREDISTNATRVTVPLLNLARDLWGQGNSEWFELTHYAVGTDGADPTRADTSLQNETDRVELEKFGEGNQSDEIDIVATIPAGGVFAEADILELGVADAESGGNISLRTTTDPIALNASTRLKAHQVVSIANDPDEQGVITSKGQERLRDLIIGEAGVEPDIFVYGNGTTDAVIGNASLENQLHNDTIDSTADRSTGIVILTEETEAAEADTEGWSELGQNNTDDELLSRTAFEPLETDVILVANHGFKATND